MSLETVKSKFKPKGALKKTVSDAKQGLRLNKFLALRTGVSRRQADDIIKEGRVIINGQKINNLATFVNPEDKILCDGKNIAYKTESPVYIMLNKPQGYITAVKSEEGFRTIMELIQNETAKHKHIYPVGRLDFMSEGLLLLTNDGDFGYRVTHPKFNVIKSYIVEAKGELTEELFKKIKKGVYLEESGLLKPHNIKIINRSFNKFLLLVELTHGKNREIRRLMEFFNLKILMLKRVGIGGLDIGDLPSGHYRILNKKTAELAFKEKAVAEKTLTAKVPAKIKRLPKDKNLSPKDFSAMIASAKKKSVKSAKL